MKKQKIIKKILGAVAFSLSSAIGVYLAWFYFVMPRMILNEKTTLEETFLYDMSQERFAYDTITSGDVIGGIIYSSEFFRDTLVSDATTIELAPRAERMRQEVALTVPELDIYNARIRLEVDGTQENIYNTVLREAVAHFSGTAYPGEKGNVFLFGHSKLPILAGSDYESIFTNLPRLKNGAVIEVTQGAVRYRYRVNSTAILAPHDVFILNQPEQERLLTLMTCIPPGFNSKRYVAVASLIGVDTV